MYLSFQSHRIGQEWLNVRCVTLTLILPFSLSCVNACALSCVNACAHFIVDTHLEYLPVLTLCS